MADRAVGADFAMLIDFEKHSPDPSRVFRAAQAMIAAFEEIDRDLVRVLDDHLQPVLMLEDLDAGSLRVWLSQMLQIAPDDALKNLDWKPLVGAYLLGGKHVLINFLNRSSKVTSRADLEAVSAELQQLAEATQVRALPIYLPPSPETIAREVERLSEATTHLRDADRVHYVTDEATSSLDRASAPPPGQFEQLLTREELVSTVRMIKQVKKPDYLGQSRWEFYHDGRIIEARIEDDDWLGRFQRREVLLRPGDALRAEVRVSTRYGYDNRGLSSSYTVERVLDVIPGEPGQPELIL
jgi:hypothetical protein